jgi:hypothetical protein
MFRIRSYAGAKNRVPYGALVLHTTHTSVGSAQTELVVYAARFDRGEISLVTVDDLRRDGKSVNLKSHLDCDAWVKDVR